MKFYLFSHNGQICNIEDAVIPLSSIEYAYGFGVYENIRVSKGVAKYVDEHVERLLNSAKILGLEHSWIASDIESFVEELVVSLDSARDDTSIRNDNIVCHDSSDLIMTYSYNVKILLIGGKTKDDASFNIIPLAPCFPEKKWYKIGVDVITYEYERLYPQAKTLNMLGSYMAYKKAHEEGAYDALLISRDGFLLEGTRTNLFAIKGSELITTPDDCVLPGVTRKHVIECALKNSFTIKYECFGVGDLKNFDGLFLTSTSSKILPIRKVDWVELGEITKELKKLMQEFTVLGVQPRLCKWIGHN